MYNFPQDIEATIELVINEQTLPTEDIPDLPKFIEQNEAWITRLQQFAESHRSALALAANQIKINGKPVLLNFFFMRKFLLSGEMELVCNPKIIEKAGYAFWRNEGCLSWPGKSVHAKRHHRIVVMTNDNGTPKGYHGLYAQVYQHEIDHLTGTPHEVHEDDEALPEVVKPKRHMLCICGSGLKFKKCCGRP